MFNIFPETLNITRRTLFLMQNNSHMSASIINRPAPDFSLPDHDGKIFRLHGHVGAHILVLFFYPKDHSYGCTAEACAFRDAYEDFVDAGARVIGISRDTVESHAGFRNANRLNFSLLSDPDGHAAQLFGVNHSLFGLLPGRVTFVIDKKGIIRKTFNSQLKFKNHMQEALDFVKNISNETHA